MKFTKTILATALLAGAGVAQAELSANIAAASNYYFRGVSQTDDGAAVSGGIDYNHESGFYVGTWMSNIDFTSAPKADVEVDGYAGFGGDIGDTGLGYDLSAWYYWYPGSGGDAQGDLDYAEISGSLSFGPVTGTIAYTIWAEADDVDNVAQGFQEDDVWYELAFAPDWDYAGFAPSASIGYYSFDQDGEGNTDLDYYSWTIGVTKDAGDFGAFSLNYVQNDEEDSFAGDDNPNFWVGWAKGF